MAGDGTTDFDLYGLPQQEQAARVAARIAALRGQQNLGVAGILSGDKALGEVGKMDSQQAEGEQRALEGTSKNVLGETLRSADQKRKADWDAERARKNDAQVAQQLAIEARRQHQEGVQNDFTRQRLGFEDRRVSAEEAKAAAAAEKATAGPKVPASQALGITTAAEVADNIPKVQKAYEDFLSSKDPTDYKKYQDKAALLALAVARGETKTGNPRSDIVNKVKERFPGILSATRDKFFGSGIGANVFDTLKDEAKTRGMDAVEGLGLPEEHPLVQQLHRAFPDLAPAAAIAPAAPGAAPAAPAMAPALPTTRMVGGKTYVLQPNGKYRPQ